MPKFLNFMIIFVLNSLISPIWIGFALVFVWFWIGCYFDLSVT